MVFNSSRHYEVINGIECVLSRALGFGLAVRQRRKESLDFIKYNMCFLCLSRFRSPSTRVASQRTWWWNIASRQEPPSLSALVATASSRTQSSSPSPRGFDLLASVYSHLSGVMLFKMLFLALFSCLTLTSIGASLFLHSLVVILFIFCAGFSFGTLAFHHFHTDCHTLTHTQTHNPYLVTAFFRSSHVSYHHRWQRAAAVSHGFHNRVCPFSIFCPALSATESWVLCAEATVTAKSSRSR